MANDLLESYAMSIQQLEGILNPAYQGEEIVSEGSHNSLIYRVLRKVQGVAVTLVASFLDSTAHKASLHSVIMLSSKFAVQHNIGVVIAIWAPIVMIWYSIFSTIFGGINGTFSRLGEIRTLVMLRSRFESVPLYFTARLVPSSEEDNQSRQSQKGELKDLDASKTQIINVLQDIIEIVTQDVMIRGQGILERSEGGNNETKPKFSNLNFRLMKNNTWMEKVARLHLLLTVKESAINVPTNLDARRRITFFLPNSLFMNMPSAPKVRNICYLSVS
ncbi:hypothetical protein HPP92_007893 [Vanilla planifolia]|uniref:Callose synthase helical domain-containing protein n=1 Tax=Vanilla planifolia TaxID=51239 RepID=A0A835REX3_VANPL|nr:hypothetical protein HPP92_007893 [Vanilla planifolia]